jgi:hypothetical protein
MWPRVMSNTIEACKRAGAKLIFFDNVYIYGKVSGPMTEATPFNPCSKKGEIRANRATTLINGGKSGDFTGMIASRRCVTLEQLDLCGGTPMGPQLARQKRAAHFGSPVRKRMVDDRYASTLAI